MAVNNKKNIQSDTQSIDALEIPQSLLNKIAPNQRKLINALAENHPHGILSNALTQKTGISNKSHLCDLKLRELLASKGFAINVTRISRQWLWEISQIKDKEGKE